MLTCGDYLYAVVDIYVDLISPLYTDLYDAVMFFQDFDGVPQKDKFLVRFPYDFDKKCFCITRYNADFMVDV